MTIIPLHGSSSHALRGRTHPGSSSSHVPPSHARRGRTHPDSSSDDSDPEDDHKQEDTVFESQSINSRPQPNTNPDINQNPSSDQRVHPYANAAWVDGGKGHWDSFIQYRDVEHAYINMYSAIENTSIAAKQVAYNISQKDLDSAGIAYTDWNREVGKINLKDMYYTSADKLTEVTRAFKDRLGDTASSAVIQYLDETLKSSIEAINLQKHLRSLRNQRKWDNIASFNRCVPIIVR
jgi:hypothetical protein